MQMRQLKIDWGGGLARWVHATPPAFHRTPLDRNCVLSSLLFQLQLLCLNCMVELLNSDVSQLAPVITLIYGPPLERRQRWDALILFLCSQNKRIHMRLSSYFRYKAL